MNNIINQLSQIEEKTVAILDGAADKKKTLAAEYEAKTKQFDEELNHETELEIQSMRQKMEAEAAAELDRQKTAAGEAQEYDYAKDHAENSHRQISFVMRITVIIPRSRLFVKRAQGGKCRQNCVRSPAVPLPAFPARRGRACT